MGAIRPGNRADSALVCTGSGRFEGIGVEPLDE